MTKSATKAIVAKASARATAKRAARAAKPNPDHIKTYVGSVGGEYVYVTSHGGEELRRPSRGDSAEFRKRAIPGASFKALKKWHEANPVSPPQAKLARGIEAGQAPHSAKAVRDQRAASAKAEPKGKAAAKAPKAAKAKAGADYSYKPTKKANDAKADSLRGRMLTIILAHKDTASAKAAATKAKLTGLNSGWFNWAAANGYITK